MARFVEEIFVKFINKINPIELKKMISENIMISQKFAKKMPSVSLVRVFLALNPVSRDELSVNNILRLVKQDNLVVYDTIMNSEKGKVWVQAQVSDLVSKYL